MHKSAKRLFIITIAIAIIGLLTIYSASYQDGALQERNIFTRQLCWVFLGVIVFIIFYNFNYRRLYDLTFVFYGLSIVFLILVLIFGKIKFGAQRWLVVAGFSFQPSELARFAVILFLARYFSRKNIFSVRLRIKDLGILRSLVFPGILVGIPAFLVLRQPDLGTSLMFVFIFLILVFVAGARKRYIVSLLGLSLVMLPVFWYFLKDYQKERLLVFINPNIDPLGAGYTVIQSKIAVGSGTLFGRGWLGGTQNTLNFLPERHTDFIFSCFAESSGFLGSTILLFLFYLLFKECINIIYSTRDPFARLLVVGIVAGIFLQVVINVSMTIGFMPIVGLPLPLLSYGGTSTLITFMSLGVVANISKKRMIF